MSDENNLDKASFDRNIDEMNYLIRQPELEIDPNHPFKDDQLGRKSLASSLSKLICDFKSPYVLAIDADWGTGKTTFLKMWQQELVNQNCHCLYFSAWETDYCEDPFVVLVSELISSIESIISKDKLGIDISRQKNLVRDCSIALAKRGFPALVKALTYNVIDIKENDVERLLAKLSGDITEDVISSYSQKKTELDKFKQALTNLVKQLTKSERSNFSNVVIFIDELDRCRPIYAVELLERIKHLFNIPGIVFVLGIDRIQLSYSIKSLYGADFDGNGYLRRFIDINYTLPKPNIEDFFECLFNNFGIYDTKNDKGNTIQATEIEDIRKILVFLSYAFSISLRRQIQMVSRLSLILKLSPLDNHLFPSYLAVFTFIYHWDNQIYLKITSNQYDIGEILERISKVIDRQEFLSADVIHENQKIFILVFTVLVNAADLIGHKTSEKLAVMRKISRYTIFDHPNLFVINPEASKYFHQEKIKGDKNQTREIIKKKLGDLNELKDNGIDPLNITCKRISFAKQFGI